MGRIRIAALLALAVLLMLTWYEAIIGMRIRAQLAPDTIRYLQGAAYLTRLPAPSSWLPLVVREDAEEQGTVSEATVLENGVLLGPAHATSWAIASAGGGAYFYRWGRLVFSASDNSNPASNGRSYRFVTQARLSWMRAGFLSFVILGIAAGVWQAGRWHFAPADSVAAQHARKQAIWRAILLDGIAAVAGAVAAYAPGVVRGALFWLVAGFIVVLLVLAARQALIWLSLRMGGTRGWESFYNVALVVASLALSCAGVELFLGYGGDRVIAWLGQPRETGLRTAPETNEAGDRIIRTGRAKIVLPAELVTRMEARQRLLVFPPEWIARRVAMPDAKVAVLWHNVLHIFDEQGFRRPNIPFAAKEPQKFRVMVVGDSLTYGQGIAAEWTYPAQLQNLLGRDYNIEFINLGVTGAQSEDIALTIARMVPVLQPDLMIYGVCLNDFLPLGIAQYNPDTGVPRLKEMGVDRTRFAGMLVDGFKDFLIRVGIRQDFWDDILQGLDVYQKRFAGDLAHMSAIAAARGLPPIVGMVLDVGGEYEGRGHRLARIAEAAMRDAGFDVIPSETLYRQYAGRPMRVSRWEGHPNEEANAIFATLFADRLDGRLALEGFRRRRDATIEGDGPGAH